MTAGCVADRGRIPAWVISPARGIDRIRSVDGDAGRAGIEFVGGDTTLQRVGIIFVVAVIFGLVNAIIKPIVQIISIPLYILTLGLFHIVINALMLWITSWITEHTTHWGLYIDDFWWTAIWAAIVLSIVSWRCR